MSATHPSGWHLEHSYARALPQLARPWAAARFAQPEMLLFNAPLARRLGLDPADVPGGDLATYLAGQSFSEGDGPVALAYAGHQFGHFNPQLGDGRALLLGEVIAPDGTRHDLHLKGSGATPFSRGGDGKAALGPMLREFLISEAMAALGVPTTRSLAVITTGEGVWREAPLPGAILVRTAASHIRIGTFQFAAAHLGPDAVQSLADHAIARHHPHCAAADNPYAALLEAVCTAQARLIAQWLSYGFVHGVMNTDNMTISGETIDYGPCAFIDAYRPDAVFSSIDHHGRYAYGRQPQIAAWNLARFAECLLPLLGDGDAAQQHVANAALAGFAPAFEAAWHGAMAAKIGLAGAPADDAALIGDLLALMAAAEADFTLFFRALSSDPGAESLAAAALFADPAPFLAWQGRWHAELARSGADMAEARRRMRQANPAIIARNHQVEAALSAAQDAADLAPFHALLAALQSPFDDPPATQAHLAQPPPAGSPRCITYCGT